MHVLEIYVHLWGLLYQEQLPRPIASNYLRRTAKVMFSSLLVCLLLLAKIYNFGKNVRLSGCLSVGVSVRFVKHNSWTLRHIITKLDPYMYWVTGSCKLPGQICRSQNKVTRSKNRSNLEIAITPSIFLARTSIKSSKCRACSWLSCLCDQLPVAFLTKKFAPALKFRHFKFFECSYNLTSDIERSSQIMQEKIFSWWWRHRWRHRKTSNGPSIFPCKWKMIFFRDNWTNTRDFIVILSAYM